MSHSNLGCFEQLYCSIKTCFLDETIRNSFVMIPSNIIRILQVHEWSKSMCIPQLNTMLDYYRTNELQNLHFVYHQYYLITFSGFLFGLHVRINGWQPNMLLIPKTLFDNNLYLSHMCIECLFASFWYLIIDFIKTKSRIENLLFIMTFFTS